MERVIEGIDREILSLEKDLEQVTGTKTEVYTRIVGYHRAISNWNKGKREEYNHRVCFDVNKSMNNKIVEKHTAGLVMKTSSENSFSTYGTAVKYIFFYGEFCRNCKPVQDYIENLNMPGELVDVGSELGLNVARSFNVTATPTVVMLNEKNQLVTKLFSKDDIIKFTNKAIEATA